MPLINSEVNLILTWSSTCVTTNFTGAGIFTITDTKPYVPITTFSTQDNTKILQQLKCGFKRTTHWNKCQSNPKIYAQNRYNDHLVDLSFKGMNRFLIFCIIFWKWGWYKITFRCCLPKVEMIDGKNVFDQPINNDTNHMKISENLFLGKEMITPLLVC